MNYEMLNKIITNLAGCYDMFDYMLTPKESHLLLSYIKELQQENKKQKYIINEINVIIKGVGFGGSEDYYIEKFNKINELIKEVSK